MELFVSIIEFGLILFIGFVIGVVVSRLHMGNKNSKTREETNKEYYNIRRDELNADIRTGLTAHFNMTSELTEKETELLLLFLERHNFVLCFVDGGFRVRKNDFLKPQLDKVVQVVEREVALQDPNDFQYTNMIESRAVSLVDYELRDLRMRLNNMGPYRATSGYGDDEPFQLFPWG